MNSDLAGKILNKDKRAVARVLLSLKIVILTPQNCLKKFTLKLDGLSELALQVLRVQAKVHSQTSLLNTTGRKEKL